MLQRHGISRLSNAGKNVLHLNGPRCLSSVSPASHENSKVIFSGIQPTGVPHLGNYLGALRQWVKLQDNEPSQSTLIYSLVDLHAITIKQDPQQLREWKKQSLAMLLAIGLSPERSIIFHQSDVAAHTELMWILSCQASTGYLGRMTQWKDKTANEKENSERLKLGLFSYPVLQAADVLVHGATHVPVGHDQAQHLEFTRELAIGFNAVFGAGKEVLVPPQTVISPAKRVMSLTDPMAKMSKSHANPKSRILLTDSTEVIKAKLKSAVTDSFDGITYEPEKRPGVSNLIDILYHTSHEDQSTTQTELAAEYSNSSLKVLKESVAAVVDSMVAPIRERYMEVMSDTKLLQDTAHRGAELATKNAMIRLQSVRRAVGLS